METTLNRVIGYPPSAKIQRQKIFSKESQDKLKLLKRYIILGAYDSEKFALYDYLRKKIISEPKSILDLKEFRLIGQYKSLDTITIIEIRQFS